MKIITDNGAWVVLGSWHGAERVLHRGSLLGCIAWRAAQ
jgi:hypothetical protein